MKLSITTPVPLLETSRNNFVVEITTNNEHTEEQSYLTVGPFKRHSEEVNLQSLIQLLASMEEMARTAEEDEKYDYDYVLGFYQWFSPDVTDMSDFETYYPFIINTHGKEVLERLFELSEGFTTEWPMDTSHGFHHEMIAGYKVFYYDESGTKFNVEVNLATT